MARLIVEAAQAFTAIDQIPGIPSKTIQAERKARLRILGIFVSVTFADSGWPVMKLEEKNFMLTNYSNNDLFDFRILKVTERRWDPGDLGLSGVYMVEAGITNESFEFVMDKKQGLGLRVVTLNQLGIAENMGQTIFMFTVS